MILLRHGQSEWNASFTATRIDPGLPDAKLTALGQRQAEDAAAALAGRTITRIIASPYTRAMQTAAPSARLRGLPVQISPMVRERYAFSCDIGSPCSKLALDWPQHDFSGIDEIWWESIEETPEAAQARAALFRAEAAALPDHAETLVVSHWGFLLALTGQSVENGAWLEWHP